MPTPHPNPALRALKAARGFALRVAATHLLPDGVMFLRGPGSGGHRRIALTFDDGPHELTERYLEVLAAAKARATFFLVGRACVEHPGVAEAIARAGHEVAGHGFTHTEFPKLRGPDLKDELERTEALLPVARNGRRAMVRPPRGIVTPRSLLRCFRAGYSSAMWSHDTFDWEARTAEEVLRHARPEQIAPGEIILMHEGKSWTLEALPRLLGDLQGAGFELVTISELFAS